MEKPGLEASCSVVGGCHICSILATSDKDLQMLATAHCREHQLLHVLNYKACVTLQLAQQAT